MTLTKGKRDVLPSNDDPEGIIVEARTADICTRVGAAGYRRQRKLRCLASTRRQEAVVTSSLCPDGVHSEELPVGRPNEGSVHTSSAGRAPHLFMALIEQSTALKMGVIRKGRPLCTIVGSIRPRRRP